MNLEGLRASNVEELMRYLTDDEKRELSSLIEQDHRLFRAQAGPQADALYNTAETLGFGGAGGGGKSYLVCGLALEYHIRTLILRRQKAQTEKFVQDFTKILGSQDGYSSQRSAWNYGKRLIEFGGLDGPMDHQKWQGRDHDLKAIDEATECREGQVRFVLGWNRTDVPDQRVRSLLTFNPPTTAAGRWVLKYFAPWIDKKFHMRADDGEILWFCTIGDQHDVIVPDHRPFIVHNGEMVYDYDPHEYRGARQTEVIRPKSRSFIRSKVTDNEYYVRTGYVATLQALPEPLRSQMLNGDFGAGMEDEPTQLIPTAWVEAAMRRWRPREAKGPMDSLGVDVSRGSMGGATAGSGKDRTVLSARHGNWYDDLKCYRGLDVNDGQAVAEKVLGVRRDDAPVHIDIIGVGTSPYDFLIASNCHAIPINGSAGTDEMASGGLKFFNLRSMIYWRFREALSPSADVPIELPDDPELLADLTAPRWWLTTRGIQVEPKRGKPDAEGRPTGLVARLGRSTDKGDAVIYASIMTPKRHMRLGPLAVSAGRVAQGSYGEANAGRDW
jgi:hypothetical protein